MIIDRAAELWVAREYVISKFLKDRSRAVSLSKLKGAYSQSYEGFNADDIDTVFRLLEEKGWIYKEGPGYFLVDKSVPPPEFGK